MTKIKLDDYVHIGYANRRGIVIDDRGGCVGRWKVEADDGRIWYASTRDLTVVTFTTEEIETNYEVLLKPEPVEPIDWAQRSKESMANILKKHSK